MWKVSQSRSLKKDTLENMAYGYFKKNYQDQLSTTTADDLMIK